MVQNNFNPGIFQVTGNHGDRTTTQLRSVRGDQKSLHLKHPTFRSGTMPPERAIPSPRNLHELLPPRLPDELHLPPLLTLLLDTHNNNDNQSLLQENSQPNLQPTRLPPRPRLGLAPPTHHQPSRLRQRTKRLPSTRSITILPRCFVIESEHQCDEQYICDDQWRGEVS